MDFLNRAYLQLSDRYRSMTPGSRLTVGLLAAVVLLSVGYLGTHQTASPEVDLMHGEPVAAGQLPLMEAAFAKANLKGHEVRGASIFVPRGQEAAYMAALADAKALPPNFGDALREAINSGNPFENSRQRDQRTKIGTQETLALIICKMPGVESAYVLYDVDTKPGFNKDKVITATACVKPTGSNQLGEAQVSNIRYLVAGTIAGLRPENVTVSDLNGRTWHGSPEERRNAEGDRYISLKQTYEQGLKAKILGALCYIPNVTVETNVELAQEQAAPARQSKRTPNAVRERAAGAQSLNRGNQSHASGSVSQQPNTATVLKALLGGSRGSDESDTEQARPVVDEAAEKFNANLTPVSARASVGVPMSYFKKVWQERNPAEVGHATRVPNQAALDQIRGEVSATIQRHVAQLLPSAESTAEASELVTVTTFQDIPIVEPPVPSLGQDALSWLRQSWRIVASIALALVGLLVLQSMVRSGTGGANAETTAPVADNEDVAEIGEAVVPPPHARRFAHSRSPYREELSELVEDNPDAAANVLRSWIGQGG